jgi:N-sulfoglucosamine sulfohydrolase
MVLFPKMLKQQGYFTEQTGKFHLGKYAVRGFDVVQDYAKLKSDLGEDVLINILQERPMDKPFMLQYASKAHRSWDPNDLSGTHDPSRVASPIFGKRERDQ